MLYILLLLFYFCIATCYGTVFYSNKRLMSYIFPLQANFILLPFLGLSILLSISQTLGIFIGTRYFSSVLVLISIPLLAVSIKNYKGINELNYISAKNGYKYTAIIMFILVVFFIYSMPSIYAGFPTSFANINNDLIFYLSIPEWLSNQGYFAPNISDALHPFYSIAEIHFSRFSRVGADYFNTLGMNFFSVDSVHTFNVLSCFFVFLFALSVYYTTKYSFRQSNSITYTAVILGTVNSFLFWMFTTQYMPQIAGNAFFILSIGLIYRTLNDNNSKLILPTSLSVSALVSLYSEYTIYLALSLLIYLAINIIQKNKKTKRYFLNIVYIGMTSIILNPVSAYLTIRYNLFAYTTTQNATGIVEEIPVINQIFMLFGIKTLDYSTPSLLNIIISIVLFSIVIFGIVKIEKRLLAYIGAFFIVIVSMLFYLKFINKFPYGYYKTLMLIQPFVVLCFSVGLWSFNRKKISRILIKVSLLLIIFINLIQISKLEKGILNNGLVVDDNYVELEEIEKLVPKNEILFIEGFTMSEQHILSYYLKDTNIIYTTPNSYFRPVDFSNMEQRYLLTSSKDITENGKSIIWNNDKFELHLERTLTLGDGWNNLENWEGTPSRWTTGEFHIKVKSDVSGNKKISFQASLPPGVHERTLEFYLNGELIDSQVVNENRQIETVGFPLSKNSMNDIQVIVVEGAIKFGNDPRDLGVGVQNLQLIE
ncbi:hypothetical protein ABDI30_06695 [Paenibacillus cisolokensis]|uniref:hypothetical protein n=1 Tax=Paenibacillus cisolokensis TaxID=1658519 RepID=UPI003D28F794